ncbi:MAG: TMEM165/GDT1 family protein [Deltaproteobacteria bacterium]|nr:TMEM165/GDT1 family protein [Deltaproteobacteria bacterium]
MNTQLFLTVFASVFLAELGDKTQLATLLFAAKAENPKLTVFAASALALVATSALGVLAGDAVSRFVDPEWLTRLAGVGFIAVGVWTLWKG